MRQRIRSHPRRRTCIWFGVLAALMLAPASALAAFPGQNGRIAYAFDLDNSTYPSDIHTILPSGRGDLTLTSGSPPAGAPSWSADGTRIAFTRTLSNPYVGSQSEVFTMAADGSNQQRLTHDLYYNNSPAYSPNGRRILFTRIDLDGGTSNIVSVRSSDGSDPRILATGGLDYYLYAAVYAPDGRHIAYFNAGRGAKAGLWTMRSDGSKKQLIYRQRGLDISVPDYSPNSSHIVFDGCQYRASRKCHWATMVIRFDGTNPHRAPCTVRGTVVYSPDGKRFLGGGDTGDSPSNLYTFPKTGSCRLHQVTSPTADNESNGEPDGQPRPGG